jgi:hypothetical protein
MNNNKTTLLTGALFALALGSAAPAGLQAQTKSDYQALKTRVQELEAVVKKLEGAQPSAAASSASKIKLTDSLTELKLYGDLRLRYQYDQADQQLDVPSSSGALPGAFRNVDQRSRYRFRLRLNADFKLGPNIFGGFGLATGQAADSNFETYTSGFDNYNIFINKAFLGWKANDWLTVIAGKQANPFYTTELVWDADINPTGLVEVVDIGKALLPKESPFSLSLIAGQFVFFDNNEFELDSDANTDGFLFVEQLKAGWKFNKDTSITFAPGFMLHTAADVTGLRNSRAFSGAGALGTPITTQTTETTRNRVIANYNAAGQLTSVTVQPFTLTATQITPGAGGTTRTLQTDQSAGRRVTLTGAAAQAQAAAVGAPLAVAPGAGQTVQRDTDAVNVATTTATDFPAVSGETRDLYILTAPGEFAFKLGNLPTKLVWDFAYNLNGSERFHDIYRLQGHSTRDDIAFLAGFQLGDTKKAGDWSLYAQYRQLGVSSVDPNLNESDFALSALNVRGIKTGLSYNFTDYLNFTLTYSHAWNLDKNLIGGHATGGAAIADLNDVDVLQVDLSVKF